jgi:phospholipid/cholesterol/gamma-HCH transport system substrate-binding protein
LKGENILNSHLKLYVQYDNVEGLVVGAPVTISGKVVGKVKKITLNSNAKLLVEIQINDDEFPIQKSSLAQIYEPGFIGGKQIAIIPNYKDSNIVKTGDTLQAAIKQGMLDEMGGKLEPTQKKIERLVDNADKMMVSLNNVLDKKGQENLQKSLAELSGTMEQIHKATASVNVILDDNKSKIGTITTNFSKVSSDFAVISDSLKKANIGAMIQTIEKTMQKVDAIMANLQSGKGTMGKMLTDESLYKNLTKTSKELELLLQDVRLYPTRYVNVSLFGKKNKPYIAPSNDSIKK